MQKTKNYRPKKFKTFTQDKLYGFSKNAPNDNYLMTKMSKVKISVLEKSCVII